jgi:hypothetical protein
LTVEYQWRFTMTMQSAYRVADELLRDKLRKEAPEALRELEDLNAADVIVTHGQYDHIEQVFGQGGIPCTAVDPRQIDNANLRPDQVIFVNCPGHFSPQGLRKLHQFVEEGGFLFTTDWALKHVVEPAFPGFLEYNGRSTADEVVRVEILDREDPFLSSILGPDDDPQWWLEGSSYPIRVLDAEKVRVLVTSKELGKKYGEPAVFVTFEFGEGRVYHMISHFYLQRTETRTQRHAGSTYTFLKEKGIGEAEFARYAELGADDANLGAVESALTSRGMVSRVLYEKRMQMKRKGDRKKKGTGDDSSKGR